MYDRISQSHAFCRKFILMAGLYGAATTLAFPVLAQLPPPATGAPKSAPVIPQKPAATGKSPTSSVPYLPPAATDEPLAPNEPVVEAPPQPKSPPAAKPKIYKPQPLSIGGVSIRGLNDQQIINKLRTAHAPKLRATVRLWDGKQVHNLRRSSLGAKIPYYELLADARKMSKSGGDVPLRFEVDLQQATRVVKTLAAQINHAPSNASLDIDATNKVVLTGGEGTTLAVEGSALRIQEALESEPPQGYIELVVARQPGTSTLRQFKYLLAQHSTPYDAGIRGRTTNLKMSARLVNGEIVEKGKVFSTNLAIGPRNAANGWKEAKMFMNGQVVDGVGAGICQCATTIYNAALLANLPIIERHQHSFRISYAPASRDAAIYWGQKDMKFRNNTSGPIYVQTFVKGGRFHVRLYGVEPVRENVILESKVLSRKNGTRSEAYRIVESSTGRKREFLSRDYYKPKPN